MVGNKSLNSKSGHAPDYFLIAVLGILVLLGILVITI